MLVLTNSVQVPTAHNCHSYDVLYWSPNKKNRKRVVHALLLLLFSFFLVGVGQDRQVGCNCGGQLTIIAGKCDPNQESQLKIDLDCVFFFNAFLFTWKKKKHYGTIYWIRLTNMLITETCVTKNKRISSSWMGIEPCTWKIRCSIRCHIGHSTIPLV